jgi:hypothetical protein
LRVEHHHHGVKELEVVVVLRIKRECDGMTTLRAIGWIRVLLSELFGLWLIFGEDEPNRTEKAQTP